MSRTSKSMMLQFVAAGALPGPGQAPPYDSLPFLVTCTPFRFDSLLFPFERKAAKEERNMFLTAKIKNSGVCTPSTAYLLDGKSPVQGYQTRVRLDEEHFFLGKSKKIQTSKNVIA